MPRIGTVYAGNRVETAYQAGTVTGFAVDAAAIGRGVVGGVRYVHNAGGIANAARDLASRARNFGRRPASDPTRALPAGASVNQWAGATVSRVTQRDEVFYRVWGGQSSQAGEWLTPIRPTSGAAARAGLALPPGNTAESVSRVVVPAGTRVQVGTAGEAFGMPGGWPQVRLLERIPLEAFGKGVRLPW